MNRLNRRIVYALAFAVTILGSMPVTALAAAGGQGDPGIAPAPNIQLQVNEMSPAQRTFYKQKLQLLAAFEQAQSGGVQPNYCVPQCVPNAYSEYMVDVLEGGSDSWCGPATAEEMYSSFHHYWPSVPYITQATAKSELAAAGHYTDSTGTDSTGLKYEMNKHQTNNPYAIVHVSGASDVYDDTAVDIGGYNFPSTFDGETDGYYSHPLAPQYASVNWRHWFPAYGYDASYNIKIADPHFQANYTYTDTAIYHFIFDLFGGTNAQLTW